MNLFPDPLFNYPFSMIQGKITVAVLILLVAARSTCRSETPDPAAPSSLLEQADLEFLEGIARDVVESSRVRPGEKVGEFGPNSTGGTLIRPGGRDCYPAFWIRDYAMSLDCGLITAGEQRHMLLLTAEHQPDQEIRLRSGSILPPGSIPDHITFGGKPIFFPGTLEDFTGQGGEKWGALPCLDDAFFFIKMGHIYVDEGNDPEILKLDIRGKSLLQRLEDAFAMPPCDPGTGLVMVDDQTRGIAFGFTDTTCHTGKLLTTSVLKYRAALQLAELCALAGRPEKEARYRETADRLKASMGKTFSSGDSGLLRASTGTSAQPDVWGSAMAVYFGALDDGFTDLACRGLAECLSRSTIDWKGNIRHVPTDLDFSADSPWEKSLLQKNTYQNGGYWNTPTGWVCAAVARVDPGLARRLARDFVRELREGDYRKGPEYGSPWECMHPNGHRQNPVYMTSVTVPLGVFRQAH